MGNSLTRLFVKDMIREGAQLTLTGDDAQHMRALRARVGEGLEVACPAGVYRATVAEAGKNSFVLNICSVLKDSREIGLRLVLFQALPKGAKMELILQKAVELGVSEVVPVHTLRSVSTGDRAGRWGRIAHQAAMQCRRDFIPIIQNIHNIAEAIKYAESLELSLVAYEEERANTISQNLRKAQSIGIFIGPEGGFDLSEIEILSSANVNAVSLGRRILRTETAAIAALTAVLFAMGEM